MQWIAIAGWVVALGLGLGWCFHYRGLVGRVVRALKVEHALVVEKLNKRIDKLQGQKK